jgi:hypothetical protein
MGLVYVEDVDPAGFQPHRAKLMRARSKESAQGRSQSKLTDVERHRRFKDMAREVGAEGEAPDFDGTVKRLAAQPKPADGKKRDD